MTKAAKCCDTFDEALLVWQVVAGQRLHCNNTIPEADASNALTVQLETSFGRIVRCKTTERFWDSCIVGSWLDQGRPGHGH